MARIDNNPLARENFGEAVSYAKGGVREPLHCSSFFQEFPSYSFHYISVMD